jgi:hypothetical protein
MAILTVVVLLALMGVYALVASFGFVMSAFCFDQGTSSGAWSCFTGINSIFSGPSVIAIIVGWVQFFRKRYRAALLIGAIPLTLVAIAYVALFFMNSSWMP